jgi:hypothetical protein
MTKNNQIQKCTYPVAENKFGIMHMHCADNQPISEADLKKVIDGPIAAVEADYQAEISQTKNYKAVLE